MRPSAGNSHRYRELRWRAWARSWRLENEIHLLSHYRTRGLRSTILTFSVCCRFTGNVIDFFPFFFFSESACSVSFLFFISLPIYIVFLSFFSFFIIFFSNGCCLRIGMHKAVMNYYYYIHFFFVSPYPVYVAFLQFLCQTLFPRLCPPPLPAPTFLFIYFLTPFLQSNVKCPFLSFFCIAL